MERSRSRSRSRTPDPRSPRLLPPIVIDADAASIGDLSPAICSSSNSTSSQARSKIWSYYHRSCVAKDPISTSWSRMEKKSGLGKNSKPTRTRSFPMVPLKDGEQLTVSDYLDHNKDFLEAYVIGCVSVEDIERWLAMKQSRLHIMKEVPWYGIWTVEKGTNLISVRKQTREMIIDGQVTKYKYEKEVTVDIMKTLQAEPNEHVLVCELARSLSASVGAEAHKVFKLFPDHPSFVQQFVLDQNGSLEQLLPNNLIWMEAEQMPLVLEAARRRASWRVSRDEDPKRFPDTPHSLFAKKPKSREANHIIYQPILTAAGKTVFLVEMWRVSNKFQAIDEETSSNFQVWGSLALHYCNLYLDKKKERNMSDFLLDVVKAIFEEMVSLDQLIKRILEFAQRLVNADRASLFLVDYRNFELVSTVFDLKFEPGQNRDVEKKEIRMPINRGIAGHVALSGETMNIPDAYSDYRFNREVDEATGYKTISILCMPIKVQGKVIGVVQMVNKRNAESFHHEDEVSFEIFSTFFGLALHHARLYDRIMRKEQKYKVALEVLSYHNTCRENEVQAVLGDKENIDIDLNDFYLDPFKFNEFEKCKAVVTMFNDLFDLSKFDIMTVTRFILTVKKNYRTVPYHNFDHGWSVAHSMYVIVKNDIRKRFSYKMRLALFVACLCHDLDHRGYTNKYMSETASPLAAMYTTSTLEHHHFNITVTILQQDGHNIFSHISSEEYKEILSLIRQSILATDLAAFFPNLAKMKELHNASTQTNFSWANNSHRDLAMAISMTSADLSASAKPWKIQIKTVKVIFEEFYDQGDKEREAGRIPIPMMDRNRPDQRPASQVGFQSQICVPCYEILYRILPKTKPLYVMALKNLYNWKRADVLSKEDNGEVFCEDTLTEVPDDAILEEIVEIFDTNSDDEGAAGGEIEENDLLQEISCVTESWDEEDVIEPEEKVGGKLRKDIEGVTWIDEEGLVVRPNKWLKEISNAKNNEQKDEN